LWQEVALVRVAQQVLMVVAGVEQVVYLPPQVLLLPQELL
jgi:hypothetical protein